MKPRIYLSVSLAIGIVLVLGTLLVHELHRQYRNEVGKAEAVTASIARILEKELLASIRNIDVITEEAQYHYERSLNGDGIPAGEMNRTLERLLSRVPGVLSLRLINEEGNYVFDASGHRSPVNVADRHYFTVQRSGQASGIFAEGPIFSRVAKMWTLCFSRGVHDREGRFRGIVLSAIPMEWLATAFKGVSLGADDTVSLVNANLELIARAPAAPGRIGQPLTGGKLGDHIRLAPEQGTYRDVSPVDGVMRIFSYRKITGFPLYILSGVSEERVLSGWRRTAVAYTGLALLLLAAGGALVLNAYRSVEASRSRQEARYKELLRTSTDGIHILDREGNLHEASDSFYRMLGLDPDQAGALSVRDWAPHIKMTEFRTAAREDFSIPVTFERRHLRRDGTEIDVEISVRTIEMGGEQLLYCSSRDISERKRYERDIEQARDSAEAANRAKSEFLANMSHEIRTPVHVIMGMAQLLEYTELTEKQVNYLTVIGSSSESLLALINDILDLSRIEAGRIELEERAFSLRESIGELVKTQIEPLRRKGLSIATDIPDEVPDTLTGDPLRLKQILLNLLGNAIKFTEKGGVRVAVAVTGRHGSRVLLQIGVTDTGIGISPAAITKIFDPFVQADSSDTRKYGGTGLGLAICTRLARLMGGSIRVESSEGVGSTFSLQLPFAVTGEVPANHRGGSNREPPRWEGRPLRILIADDKEYLIFVTREMLQGGGHTVDEARNGREALEKWEEGGYDLVLMDIQMPVMGGVEALHGIRKRELEHGGHTPVIAVTARALREERERIVGEGFDGYLTKPFEVAALFTEMARCLAGKPQQ